mgnify:CR=1 FL=1
MTPQHTLATALRAQGIATIPVKADKRPLVVIKFDKPDVAYEPALYQALSRALERRLLRWRPERLRN